VTRPAGELLSLPVRIRGIELGRIVDVLVDSRARRALGFDVLCGDRVHRFLPFPLGEVNGASVEVDSPLLLLDFGPAAFYREQASSIRELDGDSGILVEDDGTIQGVDTRPR
jgi:hypothetical protein